MVGEFAIAVTSVKHEDAEKVERLGLDILIIPRWRFLHRRCVTCL